MVPGIYALETFFTKPKFDCQIMLLLHALLFFQSLIWSCPDCQTSAQCSQRHTTLGAFQDTTCHAKKNIRARKDLTEELIPLFPKMRKPWLWKINFLRPQLAGARVIPIPPGLIRLFIFSRQWVWGQSIWLHYYFSQKTDLCWKRFGLESSGKTIWSRHDLEQ